MSPSGKPRSGGAEESIADRGAERALLGALIIQNDPRLVLNIFNFGLRRAHFFWESHGNVYAAAVSLARRELPPDPIVLAGEIGDLGLENDVTTAEWIDALAADAWSSANVSLYASRVLEYGRWRKRRRVAREMLAAVEKLDQKAWEKSTAAFLPDPPKDAESASRPSLRLVVDGGSGEVLEQSVHCPNCQDLEDQLQGAERENRAWRARYQRLAREKEAEAKSDPWWPIAIKLFKHWKKATSRPRPAWTYERFAIAEPLLKKYGPVMFERAIDGLCYDPHKVLRKNGTWKIFNDWETLCKTIRMFEEYANKAPNGWQPTLNLAAPAQAPARQVALDEEAQNVRRIK